MNDQSPERTLSTADMAGISRNREEDLPDEDRRSQTAKGPHITESNNQDGRPMALLAKDEAGRFQSRWDAIQIAFVDEPRTAVGEADSLVAELMQRLAELFAEERTQLENQWSRGEDVSTEDLRLSLKRYRSFFHRLLAL